MTTNTFIKIKRPTKLQPQSSSQVNKQLEVEPAQPLEIKQPEQPVPAIPLESLADTPREESVFGCGWSLTELLNEFTRRYDG
jgi:hypothetical protein